MYLKTIFLLFCFFSTARIISAQAPALTEKKGTVKVRKVKTSEAANGIARKKPGKRIYSYTFKANGNSYMIVFPVSYAAELYPLVFNNGGIVITDGDKNMTDNKVMQYDYDMFAGNVFTSRENNADWYFFYQMVRNIGSVGSFVWVSNLSFKDKEGILHTNEIPDFKIVRIN